MSKNKKGFTLIELLIVIVIIGLLSVGLFVAINPIEQTRRGTDTATRGIVRQLFQGYQSYYVNNGNKYPATVQNASGTVSNAMITSLTTSGDLNTNFTTQASNYLSKIYITSNAAGDTLKICFKPQSQTMIKDSANKYDQSGGTCATPQTSACYICTFDQ